MSLFDNIDATYPNRTYNFYENSLLDLHNYNRTHINYNYTYNLVKYGIQYFGPASRPTELSFYVKYKLTHISHIVKY